MVRQEQSPAHPRSQCWSAVVSGEPGKLLNHGPPLGEQSGTSPYECSAAAVACRLNASAESLSGRQLYKRNDETDFRSWLEVSSCDPCVITSIVEPFSLSCGLYVNMAEENKCGKIAIIRQVSPVSALYFPG